MIYICIQINENYTNFEGDFIQTDTHPGNTGSQGNIDLFRTGKRVE